MHRLLFAAAVGLLAEAALVVPLPLVALSPAEAQPARRPAS